MDNWKEPRNQKMFKSGQWWKTRNGDKVMVWNVRPYILDFCERPLRCNFYQGGSAEWPPDGYFSALGDPHEMDLIKRCSPPREFSIKNYSKTSALEKTKR